MSTHEYSAITELAALEAVMENDDATAIELVSGMHPGERVTFGDQLDHLAQLVNGIRS
jgi:hypothetical protein